MASQRSASLGKRLLSSYRSSTPSTRSPSARWASTAASEASSTASTPSPTSPYRIVASALVSRPPLILSPLSPLDRSYYAYQRTLHRALSKPVPTSTSWFFKSGSAAEKAFTAFDARAQKEDNGRLESEEREFELAREEVEGSKEVVGRVSEADEKGDLRSLERKADRTLYLVLKKERDEHSWQFPQGAVEAGESLADAAKRELLEEVGENVDVWQVGRVPAGAMEYKFPQEHVKKFPGKEAARVFFLPHRILRGQVHLGPAQKKEGIVDFAWLTKEEVKDKVDPAYWDKVEGMMSDS
ncbi:hypothetical protein JCM11641_002757 [Rhodosporidiobolus odoratus]